MSSVIAQVSLDAEVFLLRLRFLSSTGVLDEIAAEFGRFENVEELETLPAGTKPRALHHR